MSLRTAQPDPRFGPAIRLGFASALLVLLCFSLWARWSPFPELDAFRSRPVSTRILDRNGHLLRVLPLSDGSYREYLPLDRIPRTLRNAFLAGEDRRFFLHPGIDPAAILRSLGGNLHAGRAVSGASTVTMQLARMVSPHAGGLRGKLREAVDALRLEARLDKREILELWINAVPFSYRTEGVVSACRTFFALPPDAVAPAQALLLAVIPRRPAAYAPGANPERAADAAALIAERAGFAVSRDELLAAARAASIRTAADGAKETAGGPAGAAAYPFEAPHFVLMVEQEMSAARATAPAAGHPSPPVPELVTSLDLDLQRHLETAIRIELERNRESRISNGAGILLDNRTGEILAWVGSGSFEDEENGGQIDAVRVRNQPGSALKPFLYALALERGFRPNDILPDLPTDFGGERVYAPANFNRRFHGPVRLRVALASSLNVPAVAMIARIGVREFERFLIDLDFESIRDQAGSLGTGLALGNAEVSLLELTRAFAVFPRGGIPLRTGWQKTESPPGGRRIDGVPGSDAEGGRLISPYAASAITDILSDRASRYLGFGSEGPLATDFPAMFKTGTANQFQDIWAVGATPSVSAGVWMGNLAGETVIGRTGSSLPARIVASVLATAGPRGGAFPVPGGTAVREICTLSGMAAGPFCSGRALEILPKEETLSPCSWHREDGRVLYPPEYARWLRETGRTGSTTAEGNIRIAAPNDGARYYIDPSAPAAQQAIVLQAVGVPPSGASVFLDGVFAGEIGPDGRMTLPLTPGRHRITLEADGTNDGIEIDVR